MLVSFHALKMPTPYVSQREIARAAGVSVSAVSLALRNHPKISAAKRLRIQQIAREMGYRSDPMVVQLMEHLRKTRPKRQTARLAVLIPEIDREQLNTTYSKEVMERAREEASVAGFGIDVFFLHSQQMTPRRLRIYLVARGIKGIMVSPLASGP